MPLLLLQRNIRADFCDSNAEIRVDLQFFFESKNRTKPTNRQMNLKNVENVTAPSLTSQFIKLQNYQNHVANVFVRVISFFPLDVSVTVVFQKVYEESMIQYIGIHMM